MGKQISEQTLETNFYKLNTWKYLRPILSLSCESPSLNHIKISNPLATLKEQGCLNWKGVVKLNALR